MVTNKPTEVLEFKRVPKKNKIITVLAKGDTAEIINKDYTKEFLFYEVKTKDGIRGYVIFDKDKFEIINE